MHGVSRRRLLLGGAALALPPPAKAAFDSLARNGGAASSSPYVAASSNGRYFVKNGSPWLMLADSAQTLVNIYGSDVTNYLSTRASQGFTAIQFDLVATSYVRATYPYGATSASGAVYAFSDHGAITPRYATNPAYWTLMDSYVSAINALGMTAILNPYEGNVGATDLVKAGNAACYSYGQFLGNRFKNADVIWHLGNDLQVTSSAIFQSFQNLAKGILAADPNHLMTIELFDTPRGGSGFSTSFDNEGGYGSFGSVFGSKGINGSYTYGPTYGYTGVAYNGSGTSFRGVAGTNLTSPCPVILLEANYLGENLIGDGSSAITYRKQPWWLILAGGLGGYIFGTAWTWNFPLGWQSHMTDGVSDVQTWLAFFKSINWWTLQPDFGRALATTGSTGWNRASLVGTGWAYNWDAYISQAADSLTGGAHLSVAYFSQGSAQSLTVRMNQFAGPMTAKWVDPTSGSSSTISGSPFTNSGTHSFSPSGNNRAGDPDWALQFTA
jgi:hypothetical protein